MKQNLRQRQFTILLVDLSLMYGALLLALLVRNARVPSAESVFLHLRHFTLIFLGWILVFYTIGMYRLELPFDDLTFARRLGAGGLVCGLASALYFYLIPETGIEPKTVLLLFILFFLVLEWLWRTSYALARRGRSFRIGIGLIGVTEEARSLAGELAKLRSLGYDARFAYDDGEGPEIPGLVTIRDSALIRQFVEDTDSDLLVIASDRALPPELSRELFGLLDKRIRFLRLPDFYELILRRVPIGAINDTWFLENIDLKAKRPYEAGKRALDLFLALALLVLSLPLWPLVALGIKAGSRGPVLFTQTRVGRFGRPFTIYKFRTMRVEGNDQAPTAESDRRVTALGAFLRASRIDEIPQILNILKGEMSFVGPRPERPEIAAELERAIPYYSQRHLVKPGITGWDQVSGEYHSPSVEDTMKKLTYDLYYLKNMSPLLDGSIFFKTIMTVLRREGR